MDNVLYIVAGTTNALFCFVFFCIAFYRYSRDRLPVSLGFAVAGFLAFSLVFLQVVGAVLGAEDELISFAVILLTVDIGFTLLISSLMLSEEKKKERRFGWAWFVFALSPVWAVIASIYVKNETAKYLPSMLILASCDLSACFIILRNYRPAPGKRAFKGKLIFCTALLLSGVFILGFPFFQGSNKALIICQAAEAALQCSLCVGMVMMFF